MSPLPGPSDVSQPQSSQVSQLRLGGTAQISNAQINMLERIVPAGMPNDLIMNSVFIGA